MIRCFLSIVEMHGSFVFTNEREGLDQYGFDLNKRIDINQIIVLLVLKHLGEEGMRVLEKM